MELTAARSYSTADVAALQARLDVMSNARNDSVEEVKLARKSFPMPRLALPRRLTVLLLLLPLSVLARLL